MPPTTFKKVTFGNLTKGDDKKAKTVYPTVPDENGQLAVIAARIINDLEELESIEGRLEVDKAELKMRTLPFYFESNSGKSEVPSSVSINSPDGEVLITFQNRYSKMEDESALCMVLDDADKYFRQSFKVEINGDKLPADKTQELLDKTAALFTEYGCADALSVKDSIKPTEQFHSMRHIVLTPEQNIMLNSICPIVAVVKTKGRR